MPKEFKPGWTYILSDTLKQEVAVNNKTGRVYCEDGTEYKAEEILILENAKQQIDLGVHLVKRMFGGEIVEYIPKGD